MYLMTYAPWASGIDLLLAGVSLYHLLSGRASKTKTVYTIYTLILTFTIGISIATDALFGQLAWIEHRNDLPGGVAQWIAVNIGQWYNTLGSVAGHMVIYMGQGLMVRRSHSLSV